MKYRKRPIAVDAFHMTPDQFVSNQDWPEWMHCAWNFGETDNGALFGIKHNEDNGWSMCVRTLEGVMKVSEFDWLIRGVNGELYPCKPDIFDQTHDPFDEEKETMSNTQHAACPWCRTNEHLSIGISIAWYHERKLVCCTKCDSSGPRRDTTEEAWAAWDAWMKPEEPKE